MLRAATSHTNVLQYARDMREHRGWLVQIEISPSTVAVTHIRTEICGNPMLKGHGRFETTWQLRVVLDSTLSTITNTDLRVSAVVFDVDADEETRVSVSRALANGHLIL